MTTQQLSKILKRRVTTGRGSDVDPESSLCLFDTFHDIENDLYIEVDDSPTDNAQIRKKFPGHEISTSQGLGTRVNVVTSKAGARVVAIFKSWYLDVEGVGNGPGQAYKANQVLAVAQAAFRNAPRLAGPAG